MAIPQKLIDKLYCSIEKSQTNTRSGAIDPATREDVMMLADCLGAIQIIRFLTIDESKNLNRVLEQQPVIDVFETALIEETEGSWKKRVNDSQELQAKNIREAEELITKYRINVITRWTKAEPIATRVIEAARFARYDDADRIAKACNDARLLAMNLFAPQEKLSPFDNAITALNRFAAIVVARTIPAVIRQQTIVLGEGANNTPFNIRLARTRTALLENHGNIEAALKSLRSDGHEISQSTIYGHIKTLDSQNPGWNQSMISKQVGNLENGVSPRHNGKQAVPKS